ncbi:MAG TPA: 2-phosphosulfolactate phosphatase [Aggregicoccus sp.]|nr:2-phosphosulfolactate phosphatase [Aggregicoccus sp.]
MSAHNGKRTVVVDCFEEQLGAYGEGCAIVAVDVIRATTTAVTGVACGRRCFPVASLEAAGRLARQLPQPLLVGELGGNMPFGFDLTNSPAELQARTDLERPMVLLSTSGTRLLCAPAPPQPVYAACLRNFRAQAAHLVAHHPTVAVLGAGTRGDFREEDQLCCAWIAELLLQAGYAPQDARTRALVERWSGAPVEAIAQGASAAYLERSGQHRDLEFVLGHVDDLDGVYRLHGSELLRESAPQPPLTYRDEHVWT